MNYFAQRFDRLVRAAMADETVLARMLDNGTAVYVRVQSGKEVMEYYIDRNGVRSHYVGPEGLRGEDEMPNLSMGRFNKRGDQMVTAGKPIVVTADGRVLDKDFKDYDAAVAEAKRLARKEDDEVYVYVPKIRFQPSEPKIEEVTLE